MNDIQQCFGAMMLAYCSAAVYLSSDAFEDHEDNFVRQRFQEGLRVDYCRHVEGRLIEVEQMIQTQVARPCAVGSRVDPREYRTVRGEIVPLKKSREESGAESVPIKVGVEITLEPERAGSTRARASRASAMLPIKQTKKAWQLWLAASGNNVQGSN